MTPARCVAIAACFVLAGCGRKHEQPLVTLVPLEVRDAGPPIDGPIGELLPELPGRPMSIDERALYLTSPYECNQKHPCTRLHELLHEGASLVKLEDPMLRDSLAYIDGELMVGIPFPGLARPRW